MSEGTAILDPERRRELHTLFVLGGLAVVAIAAIELLTIERSLDSGHLALYLLLNLGLLARYPLWHRVPFSAPLRLDLMWAVPGAALVGVIALLLQGRADLYFCLVAAEGCCSNFRGLRGRVLWCAAAAALSFLVALPFQQWSEAGLSVLREVPIYASFVILSELAVFHEARRAEVEGLFRELEAAHRRLQDQTAEAEALAVAQERARLAREVHDTLGHCLTSLDIQLELLRRLPDGQAEVRRHLADRACDLVREGLADLRRAVRALGPGALDSFGLPQAIAGLLAEFQHRTGTKVAWHVEGEVTPLSARLGVPLYRAAQEALTNVARHAAAKQVRVTLRFSAEKVHLEVQDDGRGGTPVFGFGLRGLKERAEALGGTFSAGPGRDRGFRVELGLPLRADGQPANRRPAKQTVGVPPVGPEPSNRGAAAP